MRKMVVVIMFGFFLIVSNSYGGNGDITITGSMGIGTTTPAQKLDVNGDIAVNGVDAIRRDGTNAYLFPWSTGYSNNLVVVGGGSNTNLQVTGSSYLATYTGSVGIGTTNPLSYKLYVNGTTYSTSGYQSSDSKFKKDILSIDNALYKAQKLTGVTYEWKADEYKDKGFPAGRHYGVIAEDVEKVLPEAVTTDTDGNKAVAYSEIIPVLIEAVKAQQKTIEQLQTTVTQLENQLKSR